MRGAEFFTGYFDAFDLQVAVVRMPVFLFDQIFEIGGRQMEPFGTTSGGEGASCGPFPFGQVTTD